MPWKFVIFPIAEWSAIPIIDTEEYIGFRCMSKVYKAIEAWFGGRWPTTR